jgi:AraC-like DNA-binding protein
MSKTGGRPDGVRIAMPANNAITDAPPVDAGRVWIIYRKPAPALRSLVSGYHFIEIGPGDEPIEDIAYPSWAIMRFTIGGPAWQAGFGSPLPDVPSAALFGASSLAARIRTGGGLLVGAGLTPLGWARLFHTDAARFADRITPLETLIGDAAGALRQRLRGQTDEDSWTAVLDDWFLARLAEAPPLSGDVLTLHRMLIDADAPSLDAIAAALSITPRHVGRLSLHHFGLTPKLLLRRARFLRTLMPLRDPDPRPLTERIGADYTDYAHFARDCRAFLGMSPAAFVAMPRPISDASTIERSLKLGAPAQALHRPDTI